MANIGPDAGSGSKSGQPSSEKPSHSKGNASPRPANNDTTRASQKAKEAESKANNSRQPAAQQHPREPKGNKAENKGGEVEDPDPCIWDSIVDFGAAILAVTTLVLGIAAIIGAISGAAATFPALLPFIPAFGTSLSTVTAEIVTKTVIVGIASFVVSFIQEIQISMGIRLDGPLMSEAEAIEKQKNIDLNVMMSSIGVILANIAFVIIQFVEMAYSAPQSQIDETTIDPSELVDQIPNAYKQNLKCVEFANEMEKLMKENNLEGERLEIRSLYTDCIWSEYYNESITYNRYHTAIKIGETIYDNLYPNGIDYQAWLYDLGIAERPYEFIIKATVIK